MNPTNFTRTAVKDFKSKRKHNFTQTSHKERRKSWLSHSLLPKNRKSESSNSGVWDELKFGSSKFITPGMDKGN